MYSTLSQCRAAIERKHTVVPDSSGRSRSSRAEEFALGLMHRFHAIHVQNSPARAFVRWCCVALVVAFSSINAVAQSTTASQPSATSKKSKSKSDTLSSRTAEVTVSATRANAITTPVTFNELQRKDLLEKQSVFDVPSLLNDMPSTMFYSDNANGIGYSYLSMRGFDQRRIAVLINGIPQNDPEDHNVYWIDFPDLTSSLDNIQVQRGAGLISYGAAAIGGSINMSTINIAQHRFARVSLGMGLQEHEAAGRNAAPDDVSTLASSKKGFEYCSGLDERNYAFYARVSEIQSRGYRDYSWSKLQSFFLSAGRFEDNYSVQVNVFGGPISDGLAYTGMPKAFITNPELRRSNDNDWAYDSTGTQLSYRTPRRSKEVEGFSQPHAEILVNADLSPDLSLSSALFYYTGKGYFDFDTYWAGASTLRLTAAYGGSDSIANPTNSIVRAYVENEQVGWIPQLRWRHSGADLYVGLELRQHTSEHWGNISYAENLPAGFNPDFRIYSYEGERRILSVFAREQLYLSQSLQLNLEAQLTSSSYALLNERAGAVFTSYNTTSGALINNGARIFEVNYLFLNPRIGMLWHADQSHDFYLSLAQTKREPRMANLYAAEATFYGGSGPLFESDTLNGQQRYDFSKPLIKPESMLDLELGWKFRSTDLQCAATVYVMDFRDELVRNGRRDMFGNPITGNAPHTQHIGLELQADYMLYSEAENNVKVGANSTISRNVILDYSYRLANTSIDLSNNPIAAFPNLLVNVYAQLRLEQLLLRLSAKYTGRMYSDNFGDKLAEYRSLAASEIGYADNVVDANTVLNASLSYEFKNVFGLGLLRVRTQVNNLTNQLFAASANGKEFFPAAERNWYFGLEIEP